MELLEPPQTEESRVLVTFLPARKEIDLGARGIDEAHAGELRGRLEWPAVSPGARIEWNPKNPNGSALN